MKSIRFFSAILMSSLLIGCTSHSHYIGDEVYVKNEYKVVVNSVENDLEYVFVKQNENDAQDTKIIKPHYRYRKVNVSVTHLETTAVKDDYKMNNKWFGLKEAESEKVVSYRSLIDYTWEGYAIEPNNEAKTIDVYFEIPESSINKLNILEVDLSNGWFDGVNIYLGTRWQIVF